MSWVVLPWDGGDVCAGRGHGVTTPSCSTALMARARVQGLGGEGGGGNGSEQGEKGSIGAPDGDDNYGGGDDNYPTVDATISVVEREEGRGRDRQK